MFNREFSIEDTILLWDVILAIEYKDQNKETSTDHDLNEGTITKDSIKKNLQKQFNLEFIDFISLAMIDIDKYKCNYIIYIHLTCSN